MLCSQTRHHRQRLHQLQLHRWLQEAERLHRHPGAVTRDLRGLLEDGVGAAGGHSGHDDPARGEVTGQSFLLIRSGVPQGPILGPI